MSNNHRVYPFYIYIYIIERSLGVKLPTIWTVGNAEVGRVREGKRRREEEKKREDQTGEEV